MKMADFGYIGLPRTDPINITFIAQVKLSNGSWRPSLFNDTA